MSDATKLDPRSLTSEERAIVDAFCVQHYAAKTTTSVTPTEHYQWSLDAMEPYILARRAIFGEPASEPAKMGYVCPKCGASEEGHYDCRARSYTCKPAQPEPVAEVGNEDCVKAKQEGPWLAKVLEPVAAEMPEAVQSASRLLRSMSYPSSSMTADALESFWRTHAAQLNDEREHLQHKVDMANVKANMAHATQPAKVRMTEELKDVLAAANAKADRDSERGNDKQANEVWNAIAAVRAQVEQAQAAKLPKVREGIEVLLSKCEHRHHMEVGHYREMLREMLAELDAAEKVTG